MSELTVRPIDILLVEDNQADVRLTIEALREGRLANGLHVVHDGIEALQYLRREEPFADARRPDLVLLDLGLPRMDGKEVLAEMRADPALAAIPVVVLTTSEEHEDVVTSYNLRADSYFRKPISVGRLIELTAELEGLWLSIVQLGE